jgi:hypothetical protein
MFFIKKHDVIGGIAMTHTMMQAHRSQTSVEHNNGATITISICFKN